MCGEPASKQAIERGEARTRAGLGDRAKMSEADRGDTANNLKDHTETDPDHIESVRTRAAYRSFHHQDRPDTR